MKTDTDLRRLLQEIDHRSYPAYKGTKGSYRFQGYTLSIDHVQGDPFASPSKVSVLLTGKEAGFDSGLYDDLAKRTAFEDFLLRKFSKKIKEYSFKAKGSGKSGLISVTQPGQEILKRSACVIDPSDGGLILRMEIGFPANGRTINSRELEKILFDFLPKCVKQTLCALAHSKEEMERVVHLAKDQEYIRRMLPKMGLIAFVANGAVLPRKSGVSMLPMRDAVPFR